MQATTSQSRPYQGYPYVDPPVVDAPSIDAATAARWTNLPRRQVTLPTRRLDPVVYIDIPDENEPSGSASPSESRPSLPEKKEPDDTPVVYIELPDEASGSEVAQNRDETEETDESSFVQETIFYDPFENRRIDVSKSNETARSTSESDADSISTTTSTVRRPAPSPPRPGTLDLAGSASGSLQNTPIASVNSTPLSPFPRPNDGYFNRLDTPASTFPAPLSPSEFPRPPPAYTEIDLVSTPHVVMEEPNLQEGPRVQETPRYQTPTTPQELPRTQVILPQPNSPIGMPNSNRKYLNCHHCGMRVHTLVVREIGQITHFVAVFFLFLCMLPVVAIVYCMDALKNKNHYCPNCNKIIGYQLPLGGKRIIYVN